MVCLSGPPLTAMAAAAPVQTYCMEDPMLENFKERYRVSLDVAGARSTNSCCACGRTSDHWYSDGGRIDYRRTTLCELCNDALSDPMATTQTLRRQCTQLTDEGHAVAREWLTFSRARVRLQLDAADFRQAVAIAVGRLPLPNARR